MTPRGRWLAVLSLSVALVANAAVFESRQFDDPGQERTYKALIAELRCLVCQNQNLADSNAELASDLRDQIYEMLKAGKNERQIVDYMVARYGDFVRYRPPLNSSTLPLWVGPFLLGGIALAFLIVQIRRRRPASPEAAVTEAEHHRVAELLSSPDRNKDG